MRNARAQVSPAEADEDMQHDGQAAPASQLPGSSAADSPSGHVDVCGVQLRTRAAAAPSSSPPLQLVMTTTVQRNLKSLALALCGVRACALPFAVPLSRDARPAPASRPVDSTHTTRNALRYDAFKISE